MGNWSEVENKQPQLEEFDLSFSKGECSEEERLRRPFLTLKTPYAKNWLSVKSMDGHFTMDEKQGLVFITKINSSAKASLPSMDDYNDSLTPLLQMLCKVEHSVRLVSKAFPGYFYIKGIHVIDQEPKTQSSQVSNFVMNISDGLKDTHLQIMLEKLLDNDQSNTGRETRHLSQAFTTRQELTMLFQVCKHMYPSTIQAWAEHSFSHLESTQLGNHDRRHILKALSYVLNINWSVHVPDVPNLKEIKEALDKRFLGLESVKERILEVAAQIRRTHTLPKWGVLLHGPTGVGKTSIANAISDILGMPKAYLEFSVIRDSEGLTGSSRIYENAAPGMIIDQIYAQRTANLVMVLNEIDKAAGTKDRGNPLDALLPLLDGMGFTDTYLEVTIPTQGMFFIATCNEIDNISKPILDRFYRIDIPAYSRAEKRIILDQYVIPRVLNDVQIDPQEFSVTEEAKDILMQDYAVEPGVRDLEQYLEKLAAHYLMKREVEDISCIKFTADDLHRLFGPSKAVLRNYTLLPGMVFSAFIHDGNPYVITVQALLQNGTGKLRMVNINSASQREYCRIAYEHIKSYIPNMLDHIDIVLAIDQPICESTHNYLGLAVCAAILSAIKGVAFPSRTLFWGGCDLFGTFYLDENNLAWLLQQTAGRFDTVYTAFSSADRIHGWDSSSTFKIVQLPNAQILLELIGNKSPNRTG